MPSTDEFEDAKTDGATFEAGRTSDELYATSLLTGTFTTGSEAETDEHDSTESAIKAGGDGHVIAARDVAEVETIEGGKNGAEIGMNGSNISGNGTGVRDDAVPCSTQSADERM